ncbi:MAG: hypothetical protein OEZ01_08850 [Candidatus Heimdallarchaeota archaeon]|nr:hypothetical protein [Candidatus Heimdallarchaeota archaeon]MDH5646102.1 hypothetical protein [Candidatus Heimdallarchaeota archaeon]
MYYCNICGVVKFLTRAENKNKPDGPSIVMECKICGKNTTYRKLIPEDLGAANSKEVSINFSNIYSELNKFRIEED